MSREHRSAPWRIAPVAALVLFAALAGTMKLRAFDLFWHLASGRWILEQRAVPVADPFRFTSDGAPWIDHEWLFQVLIRLVEQVGGLTGLGVARAAAVMGLALLLFHGLRRAGTPVVTAVPAVVIALLGARGRCALRPELASLLGLALLLVLLQRSRQDGIRWPLAAAVVLVVAWANLHPGVLLAPPVAAVYLLGSRLTGGGGDGRGGAARLPWASVLLTPLLLALAILVNPAGMDLYRVPFRIQEALRGIPVINPDWIPAWAAPQPALLAGVAALAALLVVAALGTRRIDPANGAVALILGILAVSGVRHQGLFFVGAVFLAGEALADLHRKGLRIRSPGLFPATVATAACLLAAAWCLWPPPTGPLRPRQGPFTPGFGLEPGRFPVGAVEALAQWDDVGPLFNDVAFGGYLLWRLYPERQIFIDGRNELNPVLLRQMALRRRDAVAWNDLLDRFGVDGALVRHDPRISSVVIPDGAPDGGPVLERHTVSAVLYPAERWALVYWDDLAMLFLRRRPERQELLEMAEYRFVQPEDQVATLAAAVADPVFRRRVREDVARKRREDPGCRLARELDEALRGLANAE